MLCLPRVHILDEESIIMVLMLSGLLRPICDSPVWHFIEVISLLISGFLVVGEAGSVLAVRINYCFRTYFRKEACS